MRIEAGCQVGLDYVMRLDDGRILDASSPGAPLTYMHGEGQIFHGLERALEGLQVGDRREVVLRPEEAFGPRDPAGIDTVPRSAFPDDVELDRGQELMLQAPDGDMIPFSIVEVRDDDVIVDLNHPLAGKTLRFEVTVREVRRATDASWLGESPAPAHP
ncbi:MAG TPA: peptidylprolyl isomerase [Anaeromyxobacteraceae bacterium]|nr:peptidylprolyl isomerase [Anaeromyxobacteraceae bacterium]